MDNKLPDDKKSDVKVYSSKSNTAAPKYTKAKRDIKPDNGNNVTRHIPSGEISGIISKQTENKNEDETMLLEEEEPMVKSIFTMLGKGLLYFVFVIATSVIASYYIITMSNDIFAFVKDSHVVEMTVASDDGIKEIASMLHENGVIKYPSLFKLYNSFKNRKSEAPQEFVADTYVFDSNLNYDELIAKFEKSAPVRGIVDITFPEGLSADEIIDLFIQNGIGTREGFENAIRSSLIYDMKYEFLTQLQELEKAGFKEGRKYALEGYLYPDTYQFYTDSSEIDAISKLLRTFNVRFEKEYYERCEELGMTIDDVVNLAAIVQKETKYSSEYPIVSSLYHNRLNSPASFPRLQCDSTYLYSFPEKRDSLTLDEMKESSDPYSTYSHDGLPPSAICNPSLDAIISALYPNSTDSSGINHVYYYMMARPDGYHYFAKTEAGHLENIAKVEAEKQKAAQ